MTGPLTHHKTVKWRVFLPEKKLSNEDAFDRTQNRRMTSPLTRNNTAKWRILRPVTKPSNDGSLDPSQNRQMTSPLTRHRTVKFRVFRIITITNFWALEFKTNKNVSTSFSKFQNYCMHDRSFDNLKMTADCQKRHVEMTDRFNLEKNEIGGQTKMTSNKNHFSIHGLCSDNKHGKFWPCNGEYKYISSEMSIYLHIRSYTINYKILRQLTERQKNVYL